MTLWWHKNRLVDKRTFNNYVVYFLLEVAHHITWSLFYIVSKIYLTYRYCQFALNDLCQLAPAGKPRDDCLEQLAGPTPVCEKYFENKCGEQWVLNPSSGLHSINLISNHFAFSIRIYNVFLKNIIFKQSFSSLINFLRNDCRENLI